ncbi:MAG: hypothetical protein WCZ16_14755 [Desulfosarcinaceae bacterium]|jgi:hypothetical protein
MIDQALKGKALGQKIRKRMDVWELQEAEVPYNARYGGLPFGICKQKMASKSSLSQGLT